MLESIRVVDLSKAKPEDFSVRLADCVILTKDNKILMQQRPENWGKSAGVLNIFGGHVEEGEAVLDGLIRELHEELGASVNPEDVIFVGAVTEDWTDHQEIVYVHFWHDKDGRITGCYEAESREYRTIEEALAHPKIMEYAVWSLMTCRDKGYIK